MMLSLLPRIFYCLAALTCLTMLWPNPVTLFMAGCYSCLTLPIYRRLRIRCGRNRLAAKVQPGVISRFCSRYLALYSYIAFILAAILIPVAVLALLVSPQAAAGLARLRELQANNFQLPPAWVDRIQEWRDSLTGIPHLEKTINEFLANLDNLFGDMVGMLVSRSFGFLGGTMTVLWTTFLFFTLTVLFTVYARQIRAISARVFQISGLQLRRFIHAVHRALRAVMLGIILVALIQGAFCGIGFAFAGIRQPAFWGMLASFVAPIPFVGTALVWLPLCISLWFTGKTMAAVGLALWGVIAVAGVDNLLRPLFLRQGITAPFFVLILAILCGVTSFGPVGLIAGPVLLAFAIQAVKEANQMYAA